ncbi:hypothetical protein I549_4366 [Mycobacterium avium subsp. avium 2285 (R)]|nr:hypothetical protein I549_4366 [Mycobacterium avium subsp. avium 2285 (R)]
MSNPEKPVGSSDREKLEEDDHDLLTFTEAGERLRAEVAAAAARVAELEAAADEPQLAAARRRLEALRKALERNRAQPINDANFEKFFGYAGKARRNVPDPSADDGS